MKKDVFNLANEVIAEQEDEEEAQGSKNINWLYDKDNY
jgi:hypothetical protein